MYQHAFLFLVSGLNLPITPTHKQNEINNKNKLSEIKELKP